MSKVRELNSGELHHVSELLRAIEDAVDRAEERGSLSVEFKDMPVYKNHESNLEFPDGELIGHIISSKETLFELRFRPLVVENSEQL